MNPMEDKNIEHMARLAYEDYGHRLPWDAISKEKKRRWCEAARAIVSHMSH